MTAKGIAVLYSYINTHFSILLLHCISILLLHSVLQWTFRQIDPFYTPASDYSRLNP